MHLLPYHLQASSTTTRPNISRPIGLLWTLLSIILGITALVCLTHSHWVVISPHIEHSRAYTVSYGLLVRCYSEGVRSTGDHCRSYAHATMGSSFAWSEMPSNTWRLAFLLYAFGSGLMAFCAAAAIPSVCCADVRHQQCVKTVAKLQIGAVSCMSLALLAVLYSTHDGSLVCNVDLWAVNARSQCALGWTYVLATVTCLAALLCPVLARTTTLAIRRMGPEGNAYEPVATPMSASKEFFI